MLAAATIIKLDCYCTGSDKLIKFGQILVELGGLGSARCSEEKKIKTVVHKKSELILVKRYIS